MNLISGLLLRAHFWGETCAHNDAVTTDTDNQSIKMMLYFRAITKSLEELQECVAKAVQQSSG